ncbi:two-component regulator propeller domain-containing protein [Candidatus Latescibacterota bacterium]
MKRKSLKLYANYFSFFVLAIFTGGTVNGDGVWNYYINGNDIRDIAVHGDYIWCATNGSLMKWNRYDATHVQYTKRDGLMSSRVDFIEFDSDGYAWLGYDEEGYYEMLSRFDGEQWITFDSTNGDLPDKKVNTMFMDSNNARWFGTAGGGVIWNKGSERQTFQAGNEPTHADVIAVDPDGVVWFASSDGIRSFDGTAWSRYTTDDGLSGDEITSIAFDNNGLAWFGTTDGVSSFDGKNWTTYSTGDGLISNTVYAIAVDHHGSVWCGTDNGVSVFNGIGWISYTNEVDLISNTVTGIAVDADNNVWLCHSFTDNGVTMFDGNEWIWYTIWNKDIPTNHMWTVASDNNGVMWFGSDIGLVRFDGNTWQSFTTEDGLEDNIVRNIVTGKGSKIWIMYEMSRGKGITSFDGKTWQTYTTADGILENDVISFAQQNDDTLWFGSSSGVSRFDGAGWEHFPKKNSLLSSTIHDITEYPDGIMWLATDNGLSRFDGISWLTYTTRDGLSSDTIIEVEADNSGVLWLLTDKGGLLSFKDSTFIEHPVTGVDTPENGGIQISVFALDNDNMIWTDNLNTRYNEQTGQYESFVLCYDNVSWSPVDISLQESSPTITSIIADEDNIIWFATSEGLKSFDGISWNEYHHNSPENYIFNYAVDHDNVKWFSTTGGIMTFDGTVWKKYHGNHASLASSRIAIDKNNVKWFTSGSGIESFDGTTWKLYEHENGIILSSFGYRCAVDRDNVKWFTSFFDGVVSFDGITWRYYSGRNILGAYARFVAVDKDNVKWFGTSEGVSRFDGYSWIIYTRHDGLPADNVQAVAVDEDNIKWFGTSLGLTSFDGVEFKTYTMEDGIVSNNVINIAIGKNGVKWFLTSKGLSKFDGTEWKSFSEDWVVNFWRTKFEIDQNNVVWIGTSDGLYWCDGNVLKKYSEDDVLLDNQITAMAVDKNGIKWFGTREGVMSLDDRAYAGTDIAPKPLILRNNYPNPFNTMTTIEFELYSWGTVDLAIYNIAGQKVWGLVMERIPSGAHSVIWDGRDDIGSKVSSGVYLYRIEKDKYKETSKMMFVK